MSTVRFSWTQPICDDCWDREHPEALSPRHGQGATETCVHCQAPTASRIYIRIDPSLAPYPTRTAS